MSYKSTPHFLGFLLGLALFIGGTVMALADDTLTYKLPTQYTDSTILNLADIDGVVYRHYEGATAEEAAASTTLAGSGKCAGAVTTCVVPRDPQIAGSRCYQVATLMKSGAQSSFAPWDKRCKTIAPPPPPPAKKPKVITNLAVN